MFFKDLPPLENHDIIHILLLLPDLTSAYASYHSFSLVLLYYNPGLSFCKIIIIDRIINICYDKTKTNRR